MVQFMKDKFSQEDLSARPEIPIYIFCHHKVGTVLLANLFWTISREFGWNFETIKGKCDDLPAGVDVVVFQHSIIDLRSVSIPFVGAHFIRDPRDVIVSGYLYHKRCKELWCTNSDLDFHSPILYPNVPYSQQHRAEEWKRQYLISLENKSYQQNLIERDERDGLLFEMEHYGRWTIEAMINWDYNHPNIEEVKFETLMSEYRLTFQRLFDHFGFSKGQTVRALDIVDEEDINRMTEDEIKKNPHISSRQTTKWGKYFKDVHEVAFQHRFGDALARLSYEDF